jgi:hypothetical protein
LNAMPKIGNWVRLPCFSVGAVLVAVAVGLGAVYSPPQSGSGAGSPPTQAVSATAVAAASPTPSPTDTSNELATGIVMAPQGALNVFEQPSLSSSVVAEIADGTTIGILCTAEGDVVTNPDNGQSSSLWDSTSEGFVPDVYVDTGTNQPTMGSC